ncbi:MAG: 4-alpha-glucanotransferase, partial [Corynebacterium sp.]|nr:4-alpha-glucanotransferase [Corynebacterium sp.]
MWPVTTRDLLEELAQRHGVATSYTSQSGFTVHVAEDTIAYTLRALGVAIDDNPDDAALTQLLYDDYLDRSSQPLPHCVVAPQGQERGFVVRVHAGDAANVHIELEEGGTREVY